MKIASGLLLVALSLPTLPTLAQQPGRVVAPAVAPGTVEAPVAIGESPQEQACGGASLRSMESAPAQQDPAMQAKMNRLHASMRKSYDNCMSILQRAQDRDASLGISVPRAKAAAPHGVQLLSARVLPPDPRDPVGACSVVASSGKPCVQKVSEKAGADAQADQVIFGNSCINPIEISVFYQDGSRSLATVKPGKTATLLCNGCGGVKSTEAVCR